MKYFRYERNHARRWMPTLYADKPAKDSANGLQPETTEFIEVQPLASGDGYPSINLLMERYPPPEN